MFFQVGQFQFGRPDRLALCKREEEAEDYLFIIDIPEHRPLTSILSPRVTGEAESISSHYGRRATSECAPARHSRYYCTFTSIGCGFGIGRFGR
jgi:hypothetical protein